MINSPASSASQSRINIASLVISAVVASFVADAAQAETVWTGAEDSDWNNAANWSDGVPGETDRVTISRDLLVSGSPNQPQPVDNQPVLDGGEPRAANVVFLGSLAGSELSVRNGGRLTLDTTVIGANNNFDNGRNRLFEQSGTLNVTGNDSLLTTNWLDIGFYGSGTLSFSDGADLVVNLFTTMSSPAGSQDSTLSFDGVGTTGQFGSIVAGASGDSTISITNGAQVTATGGTIGEDGAATMEVSGAGSSFTVTTDTLNLAFRDGSGTLNILNGGTVDAAGRVDVGARNNDSTATVTVDGAGSALTVGEVLAVGNGHEAPESGSLTVSNGGRVQASQVIVGWESGGTGDLEASGADSRIAVEGAFRVGFSGVGVATLSDGATLEAADGAGVTFVTIGENAGSTGTVNIGAARGSAAVGAGVIAVDRVSFGAGTGELVFNHATDGYEFGSYFTGGGTISHLAGTTTLTADNSGFTGTTNVEGGNLRITNALGGALNVGSGSGGPAIVSFDHASEGYTFDGAISGSGTVSHLSGETTLTADSSGFDGMTNVEGGSLRITNALGGALNVDNGGATGDPAVVSFEGTGTTSELSGVVTVGDTGAGTISVTSGAAVTSEGVTLGGQDDGVGMLEISGAGSSWNSTTQQFIVGDSGTGTVIVSDGGSLVTTSGEEALVAAEHTRVGFLADSTGTLTFDGVGTTGELGILAVGTFGTGTFSVTNGASVTALGIAGAQDGTATLEVSGADSTLTTTSADYNLTVGQGSQGTLDIRDGGTVNAAGRVHVGQNTGASGTVTIQGAGSTLAGSEMIVLGFRSGSNGDITVSDGGTIEATNVMAGWAAGSSGVFEVSGADSRVTVDVYVMAGNEGNGVLTLSDGARVEEADGAGGTAIFIANAASSTGTMNIGAARGEAAVGAGIVSLDSVSFGNGTGELIFNHNTEGYQFNPTITGTNAGTGTISHLAGTTTLTADSSGFTGTTNIEGGSLLLSEGSLGGTLNVLNGGTFGGSGTVAGFDIASGGSLAPVGTLTVQGDASFDAGSSYLVDVDPTLNDLLSVTGSLTLDGGTVRHRESAANFDPISRYRIAVADGGILGEFDDVTSDLAFMAPVLSYTNTEVWMDLLRNDVDFASVALRSNQRSLASVLSALDPRDPLAQQVVMMSESSARQAYDQLAGEIHGSRASAVVQDVVVMQETLLHRLREQRNTPSNSFVSRNNISADPAGTSGAEGVWMEGFGSWSDFDGDGNTVGTRRDSGGFALGYDYQMSNGLQVGILAGYSNSSIRNDAGASSDADGTTFGLYFSTDENRPGLQWSGGVLMSEYDVETMRSLSTVGTDIALGEYDARSYSIFAEASYMHQVGRYALEPFFGLTHVAYDSDDFTETGSTSALTVSGVSTNTTFATLGLRGATPLDGLGVNTVATGMLGWRHAFGDTDPLQSASLLGNAFDVQGMPVARNELMIEAGLDIALSGSSTFNVSYSGRLADNFADHGLRLGLNVSF